MTGLTAPDATPLAAAIAADTKGALGLDRTPACFAACKPEPSGIINVNSAIAASHSFVVIEAHDPDAPERLLFNSAISLTALVKTCQVKNSSLCRVIPRRRGNRISVAKFR
jgi:hypothetical protein